MHLPGPNPREMEFQHGRSRDECDSLPAKRDLTVQNSSGNYFLKKPSSILIEIHIGINLSCSFFFFERGGVKPAQLPFEFFLGGKING